MLIILYNVRWCILHFTLKGSFLIYLQVHFRQKGVACKAIAIKEKL